MDKKRYRTSILVSMVKNIIKYTAVSNEEFEVKDELLQDFAVIIANYDKIIAHIKSHPDEFNVIDKNMVKGNSHDKVSQER